MVNAERRAEHHMWLGVRAGMWTDGTREYAGEKEMDEHQQ